MPYAFPDLSSKKVLYKGRRYIAFRVRVEEPFDVYGHNEDFVVWDGLYDAAASTGQVCFDGIIRGELAFSNVKIAVDDTQSIRDFVSNTKTAQESYFKGCGL